jgi:hypothetical protein
MTTGLPAAASSAPAGPTLRDIHLPPPPSWWPPAPGWWCLAVLLLAALGWLTYRGLARRRDRRYRQVLLSLVDQVAVAHQGLSELAAALHALLRRAARALDRHADTQRGADWRATLARVPVDATVIDRLVAMEAAVYRPSAAADRDALLDATRQWLGAFADHARRTRRSSSTETRA